MWNKADWRKFTDTLHKDGPFPQRITCKKLDKLVGGLYKDIEVALEAACPRHILSSTRKKADWYSDKIKALHIKVKRQYKAAVDTGIADKWTKYNRIPKKFRRRCRRAKTIMWRKFVNDEHNMAVLSKIALHKDCQSLIVLYKADGSVTSPGGETINRLYEIHFPQAVEFERFNGYNSDRAEDIDVIKEKIPFINERSVRKLLRKFKPIKAPGPDQLKPVIFHNQF